ncbi:hypothetical protein SODALDRAFT_379858 [Sodiomyces alkalinus F11]|uniref:Uncharacterized protein n=1 Tax=Sodiomyces alkalinus (strain CBS 110278 / VKM F-3762 / F11) TaxID=1314773 RepID=A0A3N2PSB6_SODAK|nr:hypothetical protein SODALDRAFT_379858 [Sodiomyces alkalinus F11]ROT37395.1 hypothetical protein SODALDRAFT_379858 [Sodiomyces alkalinus F11]
MSRNFSPGESFSDVMDGTAIKRLARYFKRRAEHRHRPGENTLRGTKIPNVSGLRRGSFTPREQKVIGSPFTDEEGSSPFDPPSPDITFPVYHRGYRSRGGPGPRSTASPPTSRQVTELENLLKISLPLPSRQPQNHRDHSPSPLIYRETPDSHPRELIRDERGARLRSVPGGRIFVVQGDPLLAAAASSAVLISENAEDRRPTRSRN